MKKAVEKTLGAFSELEDAVELLKTDMTISSSRKKDDLQKAISILDNAASLVIDVFIALGKYESYR